MNLIDLMVAYAHARRISQIIQKHDPSHTIRKYPRQKELVVKMSEEELDELFEYIERVDNLVCRFAEKHELKISTTEG